MVMSVEALGNSYDLFAFSIDIAAEFWSFVEQFTINYEIANV